MFTRPTRLSRRILREYKKDKRLFFNGKYVIETGIEAAPACPRRANIYAKGTTLYAEKLVLDFCAGHGSNKNNDAPV